MRRHMLLWVLVLVVVAMVGVDSAVGELGDIRTDDPVIFIGRIPLADPIPLSPSPRFGVIEVVQKPWSDISSIKEGISEVQITPAEPTSADEVCATVSGWKSDASYVLDYADVVAGPGQVRLDLYWHERPPIATTLSVTAAPSPGLLSNDEVLVGTIFTTIRPVTQYTLTAYDGVPYQVKEPLGTFAAGTYTLHVTNHGPVAGDYETTFVVHDDATAPGFPWAEDYDLLSWLRAP